jgi:hypothetical protein
LNCGEPYLRIFHNARCRLIKGYLPWSGKNGATPKGWFLTGVDVYEKNIVEEDQTGQGWTCYTERRKSERDLR